jgi:drug/metabolite transporter (DMT)-like permease
MTISKHNDIPSRGIILMLAGFFVLALNDATGKWLTEDYPVPQVISLRSIFIVLPLATLIYFRGGFRAFKPKRLRNHLLRSFCFIGSTFFIITAFSLMPLADAIAFTFAGPLIIAALAPFFLGEDVSLPRWSAIIIGFIGIVVMVRPSSEAFHWTAFIALGAAFWGAMRDMVTRSISSEESSDLILFYSTIAVILVGILGAFYFPWKVPDSKDFALFALAGVLNGLAHYMMIEAHRWAEASILAPFRYSGLIWAVILGFVIWGDIPDIWLIFGSVLVISSGLYILQRET